MESGYGGASSKGVLEPVSETSDVFQNTILAPLKSAYLYEESKQSFRYKSAVLVKNPALEEKYCAFRAKRTEEGYSEEELEESFGFLLFDDVNKANALGETGVLNGNSTCTTLGDPSNGVYISMYSDCLDLNRWYHGKSGYIAIIRLTKGRVKNVLENYTQNFTAPTVGFDCHVSVQLPSVSDKTSSFLAFERTQYYMYELLNDGGDVRTLSPSAACPFAIVSFSYTDTKATLEAPQEKSEEKKPVCHYFPWRGQLQIGTLLYAVGLRSAAGALIPAELPPMVKIELAISMFDLRQMVPKAVFETCFSGEVFLDGLYCSLCELVSSEAEENHSLSLLLQQIKEEDLALTIRLNDGGFLILLHPSHFLTYDDTGSSATDVLQGMFLFPVSQVIQRDTKFRHRTPAMSSDILQVLPVLSYAEGEVEKAPIDPGEELCEVVVQHMQRYAALINPGLASSPSREVSIFPDQYDVPDAHKHLYSSPEWTNKVWQSFRSYLSKPDSFQLPVSKAAEILAAGKEERIEDLDDDVYICLSSPEEAPANPDNMESEDQLTGQRAPVNVETPVDSCVTSTEAQVDSTVVPQNNVVPDDLRAGDATKDKSDRTVLIKTDDMGARNLLTPSTSVDLPAELIVSITSAERAATDETLSMISATKHSDFQLSGFSTAKLQTARVNSLNDETVLDCPEVTKLTKTKQGKLRKGQSRVQKKVSIASAETPNLQIPVEDDNLKSQKEDQAKESSPQLSNPSTIDRRIVGRRKCSFRKLPSRNVKLRSASVGLEEPEEQNAYLGQQSLESSILMDLESFPLRNKTERCDLKPVISECGRILAPFGPVDIADLLLLKEKLQSRKDEQCPEKMLVDTSVNAHGIAEMERESGIAVGETEATTSTDGGNHHQNDLTDDGSGPLTLNRESSEHCSKTDGTATPPSEAVKGKLTATLSPGKIAAKGEFLLSKLKSVLQRGKRKSDHLGSEETTAQDDEPCLKKGRVDSPTGKLMSNYAITSVQDANGHVDDVSKILSVDPLFAYALGLTPKETADKVTEGQDTQHRKDSSEAQKLDEPQIIHRPPSIFPRRGRIKTLKKHQGIPTEHVKKKWWLHFQTPACYASEKLKNKESTRDNAVRKTVKEKMNSACSSTDALNLLADLALSVSNDQVPPQPDPALGRKPETSLKKCDLTKDVPSAEQESVLHALLRQPAAAAARPTQPLESPSPSHLVGGSELVGLVSKEHAYSLPPSSSLLLGLPGTPFQVSPLSGSTRLLHHHHTMYGNGIKTLQASFGQKDRNEQNYRTPECLRKHMVCRRKFRESRTFNEQDGSIQITKQWKENYDFNLDSKFTSEPMGRAIIRALHGPWDFSMQDTSEEMRLILNMWIGLFYSRSTDRFFHIDSCPSEESDSLEMSSGTVPASAQSDLKVNSFAPPSSTTDTVDPSISKALDLSKKDNSVLDQVVLDLSLRNANVEIVTSDPQVNRKETSMSSDGKEASETLNTLKSSVELQEGIQFYTKMVQSTEIIEVNDVQSASEDRKSCSPLQKTVSVEQTVPSCKGDGTSIVVQEDMESESAQPENNQTASGIGHTLHGCNSEKTAMKDGIENSEATEKSLLHKHGRDLTKSVTDEEVDAIKAAGDVVQTVEHDEIESKDEENLEVKENSYQEGNVEPSPKLIHTNDDSTNEESGIVCNGNLLENDEQLSEEEPKAVSPGKDEDVDEDVDGCTGQKSEVMEDKSHFGKEDRLEEKDRCVSPVEADSDLSDQPVTMMCEDSITESNPEPPVDEQPPQANKEDNACHDLQLRKPCANGSALTDEPSTAPSEMEHISEPSVPFSEPCLADKAVSPISDENNCSLDVSCSDEPIPQTNGSVETGSQNKIWANFSLSSNYHENPDTKSIEGEKKVDNTTEKELFHHQSHSPQCEAQVEQTKETDLKHIDKTNEGLEKIHNVVVIPFIGIDTSGEDTALLHVSHSQGKVEEVVQSKVEIPFISETTDPETEVCSTSQMYSQKGELSARKISLSLLDGCETNQPMVLEREYDDRCSTPTMDEKPYEFLTCFGPSSSGASAFSGPKTSRNLTQKSPSRGSTSMKEKVPHKSAINDSNRHPDLELRTLRVLKSVDMFLSRSSHTDTCSKMKTADMKHSLHQTPNPRSKYIPTCFPSNHTSSDFKDKKISNTTPAVVSASTSQELHAELPGHFLISPFKSKLEKVLGVKLQLQKTESVNQHFFERTDKLQETSDGQDCRHPYRSVPSTEQTNKPNIDQDRLKTTSQSSSSHEPRSCSQRPVMAVKPSKSDESQADYIAKDRQIENAVMPHKIPLVTYTIPTTVLLEKKTESRKSDQAKFVCLDPSYQHQGRSKFNKSPSSLSVQSFESAKRSSKLFDGNQGFVTVHEKIGQTTKERMEIDQIDCPDTSTSHADYKDGGRVDDTLYLGPQSSLMCTVYNTNPKRPHSFLEQVSQRCQQDDPTEASMEQESLIFSEQMKQLLKRTKRGHVRQEDAHDQLNLSCTNPVSVHFCSLEEQEDSVDHLNTHLDDPSLFGQKIKVDMSDRKHLMDTTEEDTTLHPQKVSQGTGNPMEHAGVSGVTSECTRLYEAMMNDVCAAKEVPSRPKRRRTDGVYPQTEPSYHFDFCDQMKREMDESFRSSLNSVVKKSCKTKYRFYILVTSDDPFFEETKAQLEAEGHTAVQPSEFFLGEDSSSSLLIILRNEDIAEHICEVPHLLELKKSPAVQFAGIDEPDDVVNLTHQELFTRGGFIMFDRAVLEPLSLCNLKKMSEILQELSRTGKWKWMLHYRDSRRLKENARLSSEAKEKKHFLICCQETGILEVLPYHECDLMSRDQPDDLSCLARLQVQNISARYPVFITDATTDSAFGKNGILTMTFDSFLAFSQGETFTA